MKSIVTGKRKGISNWMRQFSTYIDAERGMYKFQESILNIFKWGEFVKMPKIDYVLVFKQLFAKCEVCSIDEYENNQYSFFQVSLVYQKNKRIIVHETKDIQEAFHKGYELAHALHTRLKDSATVRGQSKWCELSNH